MARNVPAWVPVKVAAERLGIGESRIRTAYRSGRIGVREDLVGGRVLKLVDLEEVRVWSGSASSTPAEVPEAELASESSVDGEETVAQLAAGLTGALERAARLERELALLRNEFAQIRAAQIRVQDLLDRREAERFRDAAVAACEPATPRPSRGLLRVLPRRRR